jgi:hypothetical protein
MTIAKVSALKLGRPSPRGSLTPQPAPAGFDSLARQALGAMRKSAGELKINGVALVAYAPGDTVQSWTSKMMVVGALKRAPTDAKSGSNFLGIAYSKAAEMADTLKNSGTSGRAPLTGECGWEGGVVAKGKAGFLIVAFSGGASAQDVQISRAGLAILQTQL